MLTISKRPDGRLLIARNFWRRVDLTFDELHQVAEKAGLTSEWPPGFIDKLHVLAESMLMFRHRLEQGGAHVTVIGDAVALTDQLGELVADFGIYRTEVNDGHV